MSDRRAVIDLTSFMENYPPLSEYDLCIRILTLFLRTVKAIKSFNITIALHPSQPLPSALLAIFRDTGFPIENTTTYADFLSFTDASTILVTKDKIFQQFPLRFPNQATILMIQDQQFFFRTSDYYDFANGTYSYEDYKLWIATYPSQRLSFHGVYPHTLRSARDYRLKNYQSTNQHRFYQRQCFKEHFGKVYVPFQGSLNLRIPVINHQLLEKALSQFFPTTLKFYQRDRKLVKLSDNCPLNR